MPDDEARRLAQRADQIDHVTDQMQDRVGLYPLRLLCSAIAPHIRGDDMIARLRDRLDLGAPADPQFWEAVDQQDQRRVVILEPSLQNLLDQTVGLDMPGSHCFLRRRLRRSLSSGRT